MPKNFSILSTVSFIFYISKTIPALIGTLHENIEMKVKVELFSIYNQKLQQNTDNMRVGVGEGNSKAPKKRRNEKSELCPFKGNLVGESIVYPAVRTVL